MSVAHGKYHIWTVGCQMNMADSQRVQAIMDSLGWEESPTMDDANFVILNTCSVRQAPEERAHGQLSLLKHAKKKRDDLLVGLMGCMIGNQRTIDDLKRRYPHIDLFFKVEHADILEQFLEERWTPVAGDGCVDLGSTDLSEGFNHYNTGKSLTVLPMSITPQPGEKILHYPNQISKQSASPCAWLPVILGCNKVCTYCIVPYRRGRERSRSLDELMKEARTLVDSGARELTLLGQTVEAYGLDLPEKHDLSDLMESLSEIEDLKRIRFMTSYPRHMTDKIIKQMASLPKVCEHVNIPVQSGDDNMLVRMKRGYTLQEYKDLIVRLREWWPGVSLSTDVIVGFCGETEEEFQHTLDLLQEIKFDVVHVAMYSPRQGTLASKWEDDIPLEEKKRRLHAVDEMQEKITCDSNERLIGNVEEILIEEHGNQTGKHFWKGRTRTNKIVFAHQNGDQIDKSLTSGKIISVKIDHATAWSLQGCIN